VWKGRRQDVVLGQGEFRRRLGGFFCFKYKETSLCACMLWLSRFESPKKVCATSVLTTKDDFDVLSVC